MASKDPSEPCKNHHTLYVNNINERVSQKKLSYVLNHLFGQFGMVAEVRVRKSLKMKGQAFVTYKDFDSCKQAIEKLQGKSVFKKPIRITFAKTGSDTFLRLDGNVKELENRKIMKERRLKEAQTATSRNQDSKETLSKTPELTDAQLKQWKLLPPNKVLLIQNLPEEKLNNEVLTQVFGKYSGFEKVRLISFRKLAFIDFELEAYATSCLVLVDNELLGSGSLLTYAKK